MTALTWTWLTTVSGPRLTLKLGFAAEFSDVLVIYTHIMKKPEDMSFCQAHVTNFSLDQLGFTVCIQDSFKAVDELVDWTTDVNIGKHLIAIDLQRTMRNSCLQTCPTAPNTAPEPSTSTTLTPKTMAFSPHTAPTFTWMCTSLYRELWKLMLCELQAV
nr:unnamed protein product [Salmo salar]|eukprot:XP_014016071.1 PREDICTED: mucosa-associated lymphoid tissue lymphoma translocation protein 1 homolog [Salmo salar]